MLDLSLFYNDKYELLKYLESKEEYIKNEILSKASQDDMAEALQVSKHTINSYIKELKNNGFIDDINQNGKYKISEAGHKAIEVLSRASRLNKAKEFKCISLFSGVGGIDLGFERNGFETIYANEFDPKAAYTYESNFDLKVDCRDIREVVNELRENKGPLSDMKFDILLAGFPCQAFSVAGYREGFEDKKGRGDLFFEIMKIINIKKPSVVFLENVKNLVGHDNGKTFRIISEALESEGYFIHKQVLNSMNYGNVPQNRERIYIVAFRDKEVFDRFKFPFPIELKSGLSSVIDFESKVDDKFYYDERFIRFNEIKDVITSKDTVYQWRRVYVRENKNGVCPTLTANMGTGGHNVPLVFTDHGIRKLTPAECFGMQGFPKDYVLPNDLSNSYLYKQAGNSVTVTVIERISKEILKAL